MATTLDHRNFRDTNEALTIMHDEWMHNSTGYTNPLNEYQGSPEDVVQMQSFGPWDIPPGHSSLGYSPSDVGALIKRNAATNNNNNVSNSNSSSSSSGDTSGTSGQTSGKQKHHQRGRGRQGGHSRGGGGGKALGANALGGVPKLGNVPYSTTPTSGTSPTMLLLLLGGGVLVVYFIWHKLRKSKAEDKEMDKKGE